MTRFENVVVFIWEKSFARISSQTFSHINTTIISNLVVLHTYPPMKMEQTQRSETSAYKIQTSGNYPHERIQQRSAT